MTEREERCANCEWFEIWNGVYGDCHKKAPGDDPENMGVMERARWPRVHHMNYCGDFEEIHVQSKAVAEG